MLDVLHFYFEEDFIAVSEEASARKSSVRESMYPLLYETEYRYPYSADNRNTSSTVNPDDFPDDDEGPLNIPEPFSPRKSSKPYIPPTQVSNDASSPFGSILDSPLK